MAYSVDQLRPSGFPAPIANSFELGSSATTQFFVVIIHLLTIQLISLAAAYEGVHVITQNGRCVRLRCQARLMKCLSAV